MTNKNKVNVLLVIPSLSIGGAQRFCVNFSHQIKEYSELNVKIVALRRLKDDEIGMEKEFKTADNEVVLFNSKKVVFSIPKLIGYIWKNKPNIILSTVNNVDFWVSVVKLFFPKIRLIIRKANVVFSTNKADSILLKLKLPYRVADRVVVLTQQMKEIYIENGVPEEKLVVINNMVNVNDPHILEAQITRKSDKEDQVIIISVARMVPEKRHDLLIDAFVNLAKDHDNCKLTLVGSGPEESRLRKKVPEKLKDRVAFLGFQENPYKYMADADIFCLCSDYEGFPNVIIEAFACGLPVVATDCPTGPNEIIEPGKTGFLAKKGSSMSISEYLTILVDNKELRTKMRENALSVVNRYSPESIAYEYYRLINELTAEK